MTVRITHIGGPTALIEGGRAAAADRPGDHPALGPVDAVVSPTAAGA
jgi:hypothetical protein